MLESITNVQLQTVSLSINCDDPDTEHFPQGELDNGMWDELPRMVYSPLSPLSTSSSISTMALVGMSVS